MMLEEIVPSPSKLRKQLQDDRGRCIWLGLHERSRMLHREISEREEIFLSASARLVHRQGLHVITVGFGPC